jgi:class 3 adenylate cyclase
VDSHLPQQARAADAQRCPHCGNEVEPGQRFCGSCGGLLALVCPACAAENPLSNKFCGNCGADLVTPQAPEGIEERKVVTILFADLVGFTSRAERLDPEDVRDLLSHYYNRLRSELEAHGGTVEKFIGDAVMAVFGAPQAHEDDPERAVRAAIAIRDWALEQDALEVRIAVNTGEALVGVLGAESGRSYTVIGDTVNLAARLESQAPPGRVVIGANTLRALPGAHVEALEGIRVKGRREPADAYLVDDGVSSSARA